MSTRIATRPERVRPRRLRRTRAIRDLAAETHVTPAHCVMPHFVSGGLRGETEVPSLPGIAQLGVEDLVRQVAEEIELGIRSVLLFGHAREPADKTSDGRAAWDADGPVPVALRRLKAEFGDDVVVIADVCLCAYTDHGHCGIFEDGAVKNDLSLGPLARTALAYADAGADVVAPSDMMDGRVAAIRDGLDAAGHEEVLLLSYAVKYASAYYGPFRDAADSAPASGDRQGYQMDPRNVREALREAALDEREGADMLMVKPALAYLDVIRAVRESTRLPLFAYNVSGEYAAVKAAAANGWLDEARIVRENLTAMRRAGADRIITYHAREAAQRGWL